MLYQTTTALKKIRNLTKRLRIIQGGSSAGKTIAILLYLINEAQSRDGITISIVSETLPHLKKGAIRDFLSIMEGHNYFNPNRWNKTESTYTFEGGSIIEFFSVDQSNRVRGPRRQILFINEANGISYETYTQLVIRTSELIFIDYNPVASFFVQEEVIPHTDHDFLILTYKDNEALPLAIINELESRKGNRNWWKVYGLGQLGDIEGKIYTGWNQIDSVPFEAELKRYGLDFGYTNDPTADVAVYYYNGGYILDEILYMKGLSNKQIADTHINVPRAMIVADSAEPKSIDEIKSYGLQVVPSLKGQGSVLKGIQYVQQQKISVTKRSLNILKEQRNYLWLTDKEGTIINEPSPIFNHSMDAIRYAINSLNAQNYQKQLVKPTFDKWRMN